MDKPSKSRIRQAFGQAAPEYNQVAAIQREICDDLALALREWLGSTAAPSSAHHILDAGCGTGYAMPYLQEQFPGSHYLALDLSEGMLQQLPTGTQRLSADLELLPLAAGSCHLCWSSLALQWCDLPQALAEIRRILHPNGLLVFSTLAEHTFTELRSAFSRIDDHPHTLGFLPSKSIQDAVIKAGFQVRRLHHTQKKTYHPDLISLLRSIKTLGANQLGPGRRRSLLTPKALTQVAQAYETWRTPQGLPTTYDTLQIIASP